MTLFYFRRVICFLGNQQGYHRHRNQHLIFSKERCLECIVKDCEDSSSCDSNNADRVKA